MLPQAGRSVVGGLQAHHQPQQGGFACAVRSHEGDAIPPFHLEVGTEEQDLLAVAVGEVLDHRHLGTGTWGIGKAEARASHRLDRCIDHLDLLEQFLAALGLGAAGGAGAEAVDVGLLGGDLLLLAIKCRLGRLLFQLFLLEMGGVVAEVAAGNAPFRGNDLIAHPVQKGAVVADHHQRCGLLQQVTLQPLDRLDVQVVGGLVQQQQVWFLEKDLAEGDAHLPAAGVIPHQLFSALRREPDGGQKLVDARVELVTVESFEPALEPAELVDQLVEMGGILRCLLGAHLILHLPLTVEHRGRLSEGLKQLLPDRAVGIHIELLLQVSDAGFTLAHHLATAGLFLACDQAHLCGLAGTIHTHQADAVSGFHLPGDIPQHLPGGIDLADVLESQHRPRGVEHPSSLPAD